jgi:hypothetical protein
MSGADYSEGPESPGGASVNSPRKLGSMRSKNSSSNAERSTPTGPTELQHVSSSRSNVSSGQHTITLKEAPMLMDHQASPSGGGVLPPVQIGGEQSSFSTKQAAAVAAAAGLSTGQSYRRKSTPAALDMALRTEEGKKAVEALLQPNAQSKLIFGNYFAGTSAAARDQAVAMAAAEKQKAAKQAAASAAPPPVPRPPPGPPPSVPAPHKTASYSQVALPEMAPVPEDVAMEDVAPPPHLTSSMSMSRKQPAESMSSLQGFPPVTPSTSATKLNVVLTASPSKSPSFGTGQSVGQALAQHQALVQQQSVGQAVSQLAQHSSGTNPHLLAAVTSPMPRPPQPAPAAEEATTSSSRPVSKLVSLSPQVPASMQRKVWSLSDYNIIRKMYTGYASTVYQVSCGILAGEAAASAGWPGEAGASCACGNGCLTVCVLPRHSGHVQEVAGDGGAQDVSYAGMYHMIYAGVYHMQACRVAAAAGNGRQDSGLVQTRQRGAGLWLSWGALLRPELTRLRRCWPLLPRRRTSANSTTTRSSARSVCTAACSTSTSFTSSQPSRCACGGASATQDVQRLSGPPHPRLAGARGLHSCAAVLLPLAGGHGRGPGPGVRGGRRPVPPAAQEWRAAERAPGGGDGAAPLPARAALPAHARHHAPVSPAQAACKEAHGDAGRSGMRRPCCRPARGAASVGAAFW